VLDSLLALEPRTIVPGHGPVMHDLRYIRLVRQWLARIDREASAAALRGDSLEAALTTITLDDVRRRVTGDEKWMNFLFRSFFVRPAVQAGFREAGQ
jgi:glyoxylase-like metal-dependent hydrolase (beta-lactamase superfamily II)